MQGSQLPPLFFPQPLTPTHLKQSSFGLWDDYVNTGKPFLRTFLVTNAPASLLTDSAPQMCTGGGQPAGQAWIPPLSTGLGVPCPSLPQ